MENWHQVFNESSMFACVSDDSLSFVMLHENCYLGILYMLLRESFLRASKSQSRLNQTKHGGQLVEALIKPFKGHLSASKSSKSL